MRQLSLVVLCFTLLASTPAEARLFWQTYGSTIPGGDGCGAGCSWNWNQDYFVPRYSTTGRYGLFSPCKTSRTNSPACVSCNPFYPGYCGIYSRCRYGWRNHVYKSYCGCTPIQEVRVPWRRGCCGRAGASLQQACYQTTACDQICLGCQAGDSARMYLPNVEPQGLEVLGSISVEGDGLLANLDLTPGDGPDENRVFLGPRTIEAPTNIPALLGIDSEELPQSLSLPQTEK